MTFVHRFNRSLRCTLTVADDPPVNGANFVQNIEWTARPKPKHLREYVRWCHGVYGCLSSRWNCRMMHVIETGPDRREFWAYTPGEPPKRLK
jgi:hypothetical protein